MVHLIIVSLAYDVPHVCGVWHDLLIAHWVIKFGHITSAGCKSLTILFFF